MKAKELLSERLRMVRLDSKFATERYVEWMNDPEVNLFLESGGDYSIDKLTTFLQDVEKRDMLFWAICLRENDLHIGNIKIDPVNERNGVGEYGILLGDKNHWGKGFAKEASKSVMEYCFSDELNIRKITLGVVQDNKTALELYRKLDFVQEGLYKQHAYHNGKWCDVVRMASFRETNND